MTPGVLDIFFNCRYSDYNSIAFHIKGLQKSPFLLADEARNLIEKAIKVLYSTGESKFPADASLAGIVEPIVRGLGLELIEVNVFRRYGRKTARTMQVRAVVYKPGPLGVDDCSRVHHALLPRLELGFPDEDVYLEVSTTGIDRVIKNGREFAHYLGRGVKCYRTDISDWSHGILESADEQGIVLRGKEGSMNLNYQIIAKAKLDGECPMDTVQEE